MKWQNVEKLNLKRLDKSFDLENNKKIGLKNVWLDDGIYKNPYKFVKDF